MENGPKISGLKFGPDGRWYAATQGTAGGGKDEKKKIIAIDPRTKETIDIATEVQPNDLIVSRAGWIYFTDTSAGQVVQVPISARGMSRPPVVAGGINKPNGIALSPDERFLIVSEYGGTNAWSYAVAGDGSLRSGERFLELRTPAGRADSGGDGLTTDAEGRCYITSFAGIQMFDAAGRLGGVIPKPSDKGCVSVTLAGSDSLWLYACAADRVFRRRILLPRRP